MTYEEICSFILSIPKFTKKNRPENMQCLLDHLGRPEENYRVIHVAGTNGKGSVCAFMNSCLLEMGIKCGLFTSPHLVDIRERIRIDGENVQIEAFIRGFEQVQSVVDTLLSEGEVCSDGELFCHPTFFEYLTAMALVIFAGAGVEVVILETGMGGRLDATNAVKNPSLAVITSISLDHTEILGETITEIAGEKAGIIKAGVPVVYDARNPEAAQVIENRAQLLKCRSIPLTEGMIEISGRPGKTIDFSLKSRYYLYNSITVSTPAMYQAVNASLAVLAMEEFCMRDRREQVLAGIRKTVWPGRMEEALTDVFIDGGHNEDGIREFVRTAAVFAKDYEMTLLFSAVREKNYEDMIHTLCTQIPWKAIVVTQVGGSRIVPAKELGQIFERNYDEPIVCEASVKDAFERAQQLKGDGLLFCVGSLYLAGELKALIADSAREQIG